MKIIKISAFEVVFGMKPNGIIKILVKLIMKLDWTNDHVLRMDEGSKAILEETLSKTREQTDERSAGAQKLSDEI